MKGTLDQGTLDWLEFYIPGKDEKWMVPLSFLMSNWECTFGRGCPGVVKETDKHTKPDIGCCSIGVELNGSDIPRIKAKVNDLTDEDWDLELQNVAATVGWFTEVEVDPEDPDAEEGINTLVYDGGCIFANRANGSTGKIGCALYHMGMRKGNTSHVEAMPDPCWQLPIGYHYDEDADIHYLTPWDADYWGGGDDDGTHNKDFSIWWCIDIPDMYTGGKMVVDSMSDELVAFMGAEGYEIMRGMIEDRYQNYVASMPGALKNDGRPMLPMLLGDRTPARTSCGKACG